MNSLFDTPARARRTDPTPSHEAAREMTTSGAASAHRMLVWTAVNEHPGLTSHELAELPGMELDSVEINRRLSDLSKDPPMVSKWDRRRCTCSKCKGRKTNTMTVWKTVR